MLRRLRIPIFSWGLGFITLVVLLLNIPATRDLDTSLWLFYAAFVGLMLNLGTMFNEGVVSPASTAALMAYLTLGESDSADAALWSVTVGALIGNLGWLLRTVPARHTRREYARILRSITVGIAQMALGLLIGDWLYHAAGGNLPLTQLENEDIVPLGILVTAYMTIYVGIVFLDAYLMRGMTPPQVVQQWYGGIDSILLPLPFGVVGAVAYHGLSQLAFIILIAGLLIIVTGVNVLSRTQARFRRQLRELSALSHVSQAMRTNLDLDALLEVVYDQVSQLLGVKNFIVALYDANSSRLTFPLSRIDGDLVALEARDMETGLIDYVIREGTSLLLADDVARRAAELGVLPPEHLAESWLGVPLLLADRVLGCVVVYSTDPNRHFTQKDVQLLTTIANQTGIATDNALLYGDASARSRQLATLNNVIAILSGTLDVQQVLDLAASSAVAVASCNGVALFLWPGETYHELELVRASGMSDAFVAAPPRPLMLDIHDLQRRRQPIIVTDARIDQRAGDVRAAMQREYKRAWAEFLIRKGDELIGILVFYYNDPRHFSSEEQELLRNFTNQAAMALSNARLYTQTDETLKRRVEQLSALADTSRELTSTLNLKGLFQLVLERAIEATKSHTGALLLRMDEHEKMPRLVAFRGIAFDAFEEHRLLTGYIAQTYETGMSTLIPDVRLDNAAVLLDTLTLSQLNVPVMRGDEVLGVISLGSDRPEDYTADDVSFVSQLATQARIAIDNARLFRRIEVARDRLQVILDSMKEAVILISAEGRITLANPRVRPLLGLAPRQIIGVPLEELVADDTLQLAARLGMQRAVLLNLAHSLAAGQWDASTSDSERVTFEIAGEEGVRFIDRTDAPVRGDEGSAIGLLMVFSDVTEERELARAREDLSNMIVHDLRGPLTAITTSLRLLGEIAPPNDALGKMVRQTTEGASTAVRKLLNLVDSLLDVSKLESGLMALLCKLTPLEPLCVAVVKELLPLAQELEIDLDLTVPPNLPLLFVDQAQIERVLLNLVDNAIKFTPSGGQVVIEAYPPQRLGGHDGFVRIQVRDTGPGVPDEYKERLFDRFAQVEGQRTQRRGTGLGLTFCKLAVEAHNGRIWVEDSLQGGAVFVFTLPAANIDDLDRS